MAAKRRGEKRGAAKVKPARTKPTTRRAARRDATKVAPRKTKLAARAAAPPEVPVAVAAATLQLVQFEPLRAAAVDALGRGEAVRLLTGTNEDGGRVETLLFVDRTGAQSSGNYVHRGEWNGTRLVTDKGHLLDADGACFCRDCETAGGYTVDDDE